MVEIRHKNNFEPTGLSDIIPFFRLSIAVECEPKLGA